MEINYTSWTDFIYTVFNNEFLFLIEKSEKDEFDYYLIKHPTNKIHSFIEFIIDRFNKSLIRVKFGSNDPNFTCYFRLNVDKANFTDIVQTSYFEDELQNKKLIFSGKNMDCVKEFIKIPLETGWVESQFYYKNNVYKAVIEATLNSEKIKKSVLLKAFSEQDIPLPLDSFFTKIDAGFIELFNKNKIISKQLTSLKWY